MVLHLVQNFNNIAAFIIDDTDGAQSKEIIYILERVRRSLSVLKVFKAKKDPVRFKNNVMVILGYLNGALEQFSARPGTTGTE